MTAINNRYDFVYLFDVTNGNPNGDPDAGNLPRMDPETNQGLVSDVCLKRKVRNYIQLLGQNGCEIFIQEKRPLNPVIAEACEANGQDDHRKNGKWDTRKARSQDDIATLQAWLCAKYYDVRTFGAVMSTGPNAGQVRGPVQLTFARSIEPILPLEQTITRVTDVDKEEGEMGRKHIVPYGLYRAHGYVSACLAGKSTGFSEQDLDLLWNALAQMFDHDRSALRGEMAARRLIVFRHDSALGSAPAHRLFERVTVNRVSGGQEHVPGTTPDLPSARSYADYTLHMDESDLPTGVTVEDKI
ncbi:MAG: type I-C CRISPR-associated protein Cas7/Csd2 [Spirochaetaceae bacterium]|nr:type I-C CRISPR-associated protein Cas7/Csd2 [Spirochaetaceae bacterium]